MEKEIHTAEFSNEIEIIIFSNNRIGMMPENEREVIKGKERCWVRTD